MQNPLVRPSACLVLLALSTFAAPALASPGGISSTNLGASGCNKCHKGGSIPLVELKGPAELAAGEEGTFALTITDQSGGKQPFGGLNVRAEGGTLAVGGPDQSNTKQLNGAGGKKEITHSSKKAAVNGVVTFSFTWKAPSDTPGCSPVSLFAWGNATNGVGTSGDSSAEDAFEITVCNDGAGGSGQAGSGGAGQGGSDAAGAGGSEAAGGGGSEQGGSGNTAGSDSGTSGQGGSGTAGSGTAGTGTAGSGTAGMGTAGGGDSTAGAEESGDDGGCSTRGPASGSSWLGLLVALGLLAKRRR